MRKILLISVCGFCLLVIGYVAKCRLGINIFESYSLSQSLGISIQPIASASENKLPTKINSVQQYTSKNIIYISSDQEIGTINKNIFGNNLLGHLPSLNYINLKPSYRNTDYGTGIWDGKWDKKPNETVMKLAKDIGVSVMRFPGGCGTHHYNWKEAVGKNRKDYLFGIDGFLAVVNRMNADVIFTVSYFSGDEQDAADFVEYLNAPNDGSNPNSGVDWAARRAANGHEEPYQVHYFEIGNEVWHGDHQKIKSVAPEEYAERYLKYYTAMKSVDPSIQVGAVLKDVSWNKEVLEAIKNHVDFGILHVYPRPVWGQALAALSPDYIFKISLAQPVYKFETTFQEALGLLRKYTGQDIPLAITEFNGGFAQQKPVPYRHTLGCALVNAELLHIFSRPENHILMANYWNFVNEYWGMIANGFEGNYKDFDNPYFKRPNYYPFELYKEHFGDILVDAEVNGRGYDLGDDKIFIRDMLALQKYGHVTGPNLIGHHWTINPFEGAEIHKDEDGQLSIAFDAKENFNYYHAYTKTNAMPNTYYRLSGYIKTEDLIDNVGVSLEIQDARGWNKTHSAASTKKIRGTSDWQYVETVYRTLPDAGGVKVIARRIGNSGPLKGKAFFKDVKLEKFIPDIDTKIPYLSVNASKSEDGSKVYLMVINKNLDELMTSTIELKDFVPAQKGDAWVLNGPAVDSTNEKPPHDTVKIRHHEFDVPGSSFEFTFEPHSLTAIELERNNHI